MTPRGLMITQNIDANSSVFTLNGGIDAQNLRPVSSTQIISKKTELS